MLMMPSDSSAVMLKFQESSNCLYYMAAIVESLFVKFNVNKMIMKFKKKIYLEVIKIQNHGKKL